MTLYDFIALDEMEQAEAIWSGTLIADRKESDFKILLYQIDGFYVEVYYNAFDNYVRKYRPFCSIDQLEPYLEKIKIIL